MVTQIDAALTALADPTRRRVVELLRDRPHRMGELSAAVDVSAPAMSKHLRVLRTSGIVEEMREEQDARVHVYQLRPEAFAALRAWLDHVQTYWDEQLGAFKDYAERREPRRNGEPA